MKRSAGSLGLLSLSLCLSLLGLLALGGCGESPPAADSKDKKDPPAAEAAHGHGDAGSAAHEEEAPAESDEPVEIDTTGGLPYEEVEIPTGDGFRLYGRLYDPSQAAEAPLVEEGAAVPKYPLVILAHMINGSLNDWNKLPNALVAKGYAVFALDWRGHGKSNRGLRGELRPWRLFETSAWRKLPTDLDTVVRFLGTGEDYPQVNTAQVAIIGASLGANAALNFGAKTPERVKALVLLSPGMNYKGLTTAEPVLIYRNGLYLVASQRDPQAFDTAEKLYRWSLGAKAIRLYENIGHGTDMLKNKPALQGDILQWLTKHLPPSAR